MIDIQLLPIISGFLTISVRLSGLMLFAPFFGSSVIPPRIKAGLVVALTLLLFPTVGKGIGAYAIADWPILIITEFLIGVGMGIATNIVFEAAQLAGQVLGIQMGYSLVNILDPQTQVDTTVIPVFYQTIIMLLFLRMDVHYWLLKGIGNSFLYLPPGTTHLSGLFTLTILTTAGLIFGLGVQIAAPVLVATLVADVLLGLLGKASTQMPLMILGPPIKSLLGIFILIATLKYWPDLFHHLFQNSVANGEHILHIAR
ncbi:MAG: flagellar biosynthetic protein FliR [Terracidiphilus sp.]|jgi:flagellar biosynthetic protein FliR